MCFEILNEPHGQLTPDLWNQFLREALGVIRRTNPSRTVVIGPVHYNPSTNWTVEAPPGGSAHHRDHPLLQADGIHPPGAAWTANGTRWACRGARRRNTGGGAGFRQGPGLVPEGTASALPGRVRGLREGGDVPRGLVIPSLVSREAERRGWSWAYWQFDSDFIVYDIPHRQWVEPIRDALIPPRGH